MDRAAQEVRSEEHTSELQSHSDLVCRLLLEKKNRRYAKAELNARQTCASYNLPPPQHLAGLCPLFFFFNDTATTEIYTLSLHDALPIYPLIALPARSAIGIPALDPAQGLR